MWTEINAYDSITHDPINIRLGKKERIVQEINTDSCF
jgi:hypothetical protein